MAALITKSDTDHLLGVISEPDVQKIANDFINVIEVRSADSDRNPVKKHFWFDISLDRIREVIEKSNGASPDKIRVNLAMTLPDQIDCTDSYPVANFLSLLVCGIDSNDDSLLQEGNYVLAEGFRDYGAFAPACCEQGNPPKGT